MNKTDLKHLAGRVFGWLIVISAFALAVALVHTAGPEWSEAIVQALAALGGLFYWAYLSRPRVGLRLLSSNGMLLELVNAGNRVARGVTLRCTPPIPWDETLSMAPRDTFGPIEHFGDMDRDQRYVVLFGSSTPHSIDVLNTITFELTHKSTWGFRRRSSTFVFGGSGARSSLAGESTGTPLGELVEAIKKHEEKMDSIVKVLSNVESRLQLPTKEDD